MAELCLWFCLERADLCVCYGLFRFSVWLSDEELAPLRRLTLILEVFNLLVYRCQLVMHLPCDAHCWRLNA